MNLTLALSRGRMLTQSVDLLERAGYPVDRAELDSRKLMLTWPGAGLRLLLVKPVDVPTYVEYGIADAGVCGRDVLLETPNDLYQPLDLGFARCSIAVAGPAAPATARPLRPLRIGTKYPNVTYRHFNQKGVPVEVITIAGAVELACISGLADRIVDLVETGRTLQENQLVVLEEIATSTARLVVNRASHKLKRQALEELEDRLQAALPPQPPT